MPWLVSTLTPGGSFGVSGTLAYMRPDAAVAADAKSIPLPASLQPVDMQHSWASDGVGAYNAGGYTQNAFLSKTWQLWPLGIRAPDTVPDVALGAGPGITAEVICYLRWYDETTGERSPLSAASATLSATDDSIVYSNLDDIDVPERVTHIEAWESRDGSLPRFVWRRQIGVVTVTHTKALGDLGEAETSDWSKAPRCRFGVFWHGRYVLAGDDQNPARIYLMEIGFPERWTGLFLDTKTRQAVVGLASLPNGRLLVLCPFATENISGWTEDDLRIDIAQPNIGCVSHFGLCEVDGWLYVPTQEQPYLTDGASWFPQGLDIRPKWADDFRDNRRAFQRMWAQHIPDEHIVRWYVGLAGLSDIALGNKYGFWAFDYETSLPAESGQFGQPRWCYDTYSTPRTCAGLVAVPGGRRRDSLTGGMYGLVYGQKALTVSDNSDEDHALTYDNEMELVTGAIQPGGIGGPTDQATAINELSMIVRSELTAWRVRVYSGDVEAYLPPKNGSAPESASFDRTVAASASGGLQPEWTHYFGALPKVVGYAHVIRITATNARQFLFSGLALLARKGMTHRQPASNYIEE